MTSCGLSARVLGLRLEFGDYEEDGGRQGCRMPWEQRCYSGLLDHHVQDVFQLFWCRECHLRDFRTQPAGFMHVDLGPARQWSDRFPVRATAFAEEPLPAREVLAQCRTMKSGGAAGVATLGATGVEVAMMGDYAIMREQARKR